MSGQPSITEAIHKAPAGQQPLLSQGSGPTFSLSPFPVQCPPSYSLSWAGLLTPQNRWCAFPLLPFCLCWSLSLECVSLYGNIFPNLQTRSYPTFSLRLSSSLQGTCCPHGCKCTCGLSFKQPALLVLSPCFSGSSPHCKSQASLRPGGMSISYRIFLVLVAHPPPCT